MRPLGGILLPFMRTLLASLTAAVLAFAAPASAMGMVSYAGNSSSYTNCVCFRWPCDPCKRFPKPKPPKIPKTPKCVCVRAPCPCS